MKEKLPHLSRRRLIIPVGLAIAAIAALACSNGVDQNSNQGQVSDSQPRERFVNSGSYPYIYPELNAFFDKLKIPDKAERQVSPSKTEQVVSSAPQQVISVNNNVENFYRGHENSRAIGTSERLNLDGSRLVITVEVLLRQKKCTVSISVYRFEKVEEVTNENKIKNREIPVGASTRRIEINNCVIGQVDPLMNEFMIAPY